MKRRPNWRSVAIWAELFLGAVGVALVVFWALAAPASMSPMFRSPWFDRLQTLTTVGPVVVALGAYVWMARIARRRPADSKSRWRYREH